MTILRDDLDAGRIDLGAVATECEAVARAHPGTILRTEFLELLGMGAEHLAQETGVPVERITALLDGRRAITAAMALRLGRFFGTSAELWLGLQQAYDLDAARTALGPRLAREVRPMAQAGCG